MASRIDALTERINGLDHPRIGVEITDSVKDLPFYVIRMGNPTAPRHIFLSGGMHGDEPAGVEAVLRFMENVDDVLLDRVSFLVLPCLNPTGYAADTRENGDGIDLNRAYDDEEDLQEVALVKELLRDRRFDLAIDCHEDYDAKGFYFYEGHQEGANIGDQVVDRVRKIGSIAEDTDPSDEPLSPGVYPISESWGTVGLAPYLLHYNAAHVYMGETPTCQWDLDYRAQAHLAVIDVALGHHLPG